MEKEIKTSLVLYILAILLVSSIIYFQAAPFFSPSPPIVLLSPLESDSKLLGLKECLLSGNYLESPDYPNTAGIYDLKEKYDKFFSAGYWEKFTKANSKDFNSLFCNRENYPLIKNFFRESGIVLKKDADFFSECIRPLCRVSA